MATSYFDVGVWGNFLVLFRSVTTNIFSHLFWKDLKCVCLSVWSGPVRSGPVRSVPIEFPRKCISVNPRNCTYAFPRRCFITNEFPRW